KTDEIDIVYDCLKAHEYWRLKGLRVDLVILNEEEGSYSHPLRTLLADIVSSSHAHDIINSPGGVFILNQNNIPQEVNVLLHAVSRIMLKGDAGPLTKQLNSYPRLYLPETKQVKHTSASSDDGDRPLSEENFGFNDKEYVIRLDKGQHTPLPWINVISNPRFGFLVSESGSGYTWSENSRENKLTPWSNDPVSDTPGEIFYMHNPGTNDLWSLTSLPIRESERYTVRHGFGYSSFEHESHGISQSLVQFVPPDEPVKLSLIKLKNLTGSRQSLSLTYYIRPVLGVNDQLTAMHIATRQDEKGVLMIENPYNEEFPGRIAFMDVSESERSVTGDRKEFFGRGNLANPAALKNQTLSGILGAGFDPCAVMKANIILEANEEKEIVFMLGMSSNIDEINSITARYRVIGKAKEALLGTKKFWVDRLGMLNVDTPDPSMNVMLNGWLLYQIMSCRLWARSAFYQSGGAFGFRDQLQDSLSLLQVLPDAVKNQIILHAAHQFTEGDVQHWWHEPSGKGTRTKISDDLLWLPYVTAEYIKVSGDLSILDIKAPFLESEPLKEFEDERYDRPNVSGEVSSIYDHCIRAIERSLRFGEHGIPLMGAGDWNDGMNTVGNKGKGESVWLGWFLYAVLKRFIPICKKQGDTDRASKYDSAAGEIVKAIEENAWDGNWYRRAYFDNGTPLGSLQNSECKIDSISQSWAVISEGGNGKRIKEAMNSLENYLVDRNEGLIKLLYPPFDEGDLEPGYIKGYLPGVRENGGQYTHAAAWVIIAFAKLGDGNKAWELYQLINPVNHTRTHME
ncbi:MAG TPA: glycosyl transferase, partial [Clostridia bacterium]|nr:glycosyl transferase [Clostridia bacterium]